jgi:pimeloyl-ACP methyl ester carboxylesterase
VAFTPAYRSRIPGQLADLAAVDALGDRRATYAKIVHPVLGIWSTRSPAHLAERMQALLDITPGMAGWQTDGGHAAARQHPQPVAAPISAFLQVW